MKLDMYLSFCTKINLKWIKDLNLKQKPLRMLNKKRMTGKALQDTSSPGESPHGAGQSLHSVTTHNYNFCVASK